MDLRTANDSESRFVGYVEGLVSVIGHADRAGPLRDYCVGLMLPCGSRSRPIVNLRSPRRSRSRRALIRLAEHRHVISPVCADSARNRSQRSERAAKGTATVRGGERRGIVMGRDNAPRS
jgi:hypothetical protein